MNWNATDRPRQVRLFVTCLIDQIAPQVAEAVVRVLERLDIEVLVPERQTCCGQPAFNAGFVDAARAVARHTLEVFDADDTPIVIASGSCGDMVMHRYSELFAGQPEWQARAKRVQTQLYEFSSFLVDRLGITDLGARASGRLAYHSCCHLQRGLGVRTQPRVLLEHVRGVELVPLAGAEECCGFGGLFSIKFPQIAQDMLANKLRNLAESGATRLVACDLSCLMHINGGLQRQGQQPCGVHIAEVLASR